MIQIRYNTFETNSSSTHSLIIDTQDRIDDFYYNEHGYFVREYSKAAADFQNHDILTMQEIQDWYRNHPDERDAEAICATEDEPTFRGLIRNTWEFGLACDFGNDLETDHGYFTSPSGDKMGWIAAYGYDGQIKIQIIFGGEFNLI